MEGVFLNSHAHDKVKGILLNAICFFCQYLLEEICDLYLFFICITLERAKSMLQIA